MQDKLSRLKHTPHITELGLHIRPDEPSTAGTFTASRFEENVRQAPTRMARHRHRFHEIFIFESGEGIYCGDFREYRVAAPCAVLVPAGTVHEWPDASCLKGLAIAFDLDFLGAHGRGIGCAAILSPPVPIVVPLDTSVMAQLQPTLHRISAECLGTADHRKEALSSCLALILIDVRRHALSRAEAKPSAADRLYSAFLDALETRWKSGVKPKDLASDLRVTTDHLSAMLREVTGKSASELISERIVLEAKRLLAHSRLGIAEIAYEVGHEDPSYFARFFKKYVGMTPKQFRTDAEALK